MKKSCIVACVLAINALLLEGCGSTGVVKNHDMLVEDSDPGSTEVYFIRPKHNWRGVTNKALNVKLNEKKLLTLAREEYTLVNLLPGEAALFVQWYTVKSVNGKNLTATDNERLYISLTSGNTYYIVMLYAEDYGSVRFRPVSVTREQASFFARDLTPIGFAAEKPLPEPPPGSADDVRRLREELNLSDDQETSVPQKDSAAEMIEDMKMYAEVMKEARIFFSIYGGWVIPQGSVEKLGNEVSFTSADAKNIYRQSMNLKGGIGYRDGRNLYELTAEGSILTFTKEGQMLANSLASDGRKVKNEYISFELSYGRIFLPWKRIEPYASLSSGLILHYLFYDDNDEDISRGFGFGLSGTIGASIKVSSRGSWRVRPGVSYRILSFGLEIPNDLTFFLGTSFGFF